MNEVPFWMLDLYWWICVRGRKAEDMRVRTDGYYTFDFDGNRKDLPTIERALRDGRKIR